MNQIFSIDHFRQAVKKNKGYQIVVANQHFSSILFDAIIKYNLSGQPCRTRYILEGVDIIEDYRPDQPLFIVSGSYNAPPTLQMIKEERKILNKIVNRIQTFKNIYFLLSIDYPQLYQNILIFPQEMIQNLLKSSIPEAYIPYDDFLKPKAVNINFQVDNLSGEIRDYFYYFVPLLYSSEFYQEVIVKEEIKSNVFRVQVVLNDTAPIKGGSVKQYEVIKFDAISKIKREHDAFERMNTNRLSDILYRIRKTAYFKGNYVAAIRTSAAGVFSDDHTKQRTLRDVFLDSETNHVAKIQCIQSTFDNLKRINDIFPIFESKNPMRAYQKTILPFTLTSKIVNIPDISLAKDHEPLSRISDDLLMFSQQEPLCCELTAIIPNFENINQCKLLLNIASKDNPDQLLKIRCDYHDIGWHNSLNRENIKIGKKVWLDNLTFGGWLFHTYTVFYDNQPLLLHKKHHDHLGSPNTMASSNILRDSLNSLDYIDPTETQAFDQETQHLSKDNHGKNSIYRAFKEMLASKILEIHTRKNKHRIQNPFHLIHKIINSELTLEKEYLGAGHGDLNLNNVITHFDQSNQVRINFIDLSEFNEQLPLAYDAVVLETGIKLHILTNEMKPYSANDATDTILDFERQLYSHKPLEDRQWSETLQTYYSIIQQIREIALNRYPSYRATAYRCYTQQLFFYSLRAMSYRGIDTNAIKWAFYSAAIAGEQLIAKPKEESKTSESLTSITISEDSCIDSNNKPLPYAIKQIHISQLYDTTNTFLKDIPVDAQWIFLTGENAYGKTLVLRAIALGLWGDITYISSHNKPWYLKDHTKVDLEVKTDSESIILNTEKKSHNPINFVAYGPSRLIVQDVQSQNAIKENSHPLYSLFNDNGILLNIEIELKNWYYSNHAKFQYVKSLLVLLMPYMTEIQIINNKVTFFTNGNDVKNPKEGLSFDQLASGPKSIFAMIGDMIIRFYDMQPEIIDPKDFSGIAIIDELDVHLHAKWQRQFPILLSQAFPNIQFIVSTHSGIPFQGVDKVRSVYLKVERNKESGIKISHLYKDQIVDMSRLTPSIIFSSPSFDYDDYIKESENVAHVRTEDSYREMIENIEVDNFLQRFEAGEAL
jgi:hypothetical protein